MTKKTEKLANKVKFTHSDPFFTVPIKTVKISSGDVDLPILYFDNTTFTALFRADDDAVNELLEGTGLEAAIRVGGKPIVVISCFEYRSTSIGAYNEVGIAIPVNPKGRGRGVKAWVDLFGKADSREQSFYVVDLPVSTDAACNAGKEIWGYPKFTAPISFSLSGNQFSCEITDPETSQNIMSLKGKSQSLFPWMSIDLASVSFLNDETLRTHVNVRGGNWVRTNWGLQLKVGELDHPMAKRLKKLGLDGKSPIVALSSDRFQSRLNEGGRYQLVKT